MASVLDQLEKYGPDQCEILSTDEASRYVQNLAKSHYENFSVVSFLLPKRLVEDFRHIYAFCRWADDLGDETGNDQKARERSLELLTWWRHELALCYEGKPRHPVFVALAPTIEKCDIPAKPFEDLIDAFIQDQGVTRYENWDQVLDYCRRSADPVGRLVLYLCGYRDEQRQQLSDRTCTALQLANFWQDVRRDVLERDRVYIPADIASKHGLDIETMVQALRSSGDIDCCNVTDAEVKQPVNGSDAAIMALLPSYQKTIQALTEKTWPLFSEGRQLLPLIAPDIRVDIELFNMGGEAVLRKIEKQRYDTLRKRPKVGKLSKLSLLLRAIWGKWTAGTANHANEIKPGAESTSAEGGSV